MAPKKIYCHGEAAEFPDDQFRFNEDGTLYVPYIHEAAPPHWASTGEPIDDDDLPGFLGLAGDPDESAASDADESW